MSHTPETTATRPHTGPEHAAFRGQQRGGELCKREVGGGKGWGHRRGTWERKCVRGQIMRERKNGQRNRREKKQRGEMEMEKGEEQEVRED